MSVGNLSVLHCVSQGDRSWNAVLRRATNWSMETVLRVWTVTKLLGDHVPSDCCSTSSWETGECTILCFSVEEH